MSLFRSLREDGADAEWKKDPEEENLYQEVHPQPLLQRVLHLRASLRVHSGESVNLEQGNKFEYIHPLIHSYAIKVYSKRFIHFFYIGPSCMYIGNFCFVFASS